MSSSTLPARDPATGQFLSKYESGDPDFDDLFKGVRERLEREYPAYKSDGVLHILLLEAAGATARVVQFDGDIARLGGPVSRQGRVRSAYLAREREAKRLQRLLRDLKKYRR
jgi:hypothetical protein